jgi:hypothetical protein
MEHYYSNKHELKSVFLDSLATIGVFSYACKKAGISRSTVHRWIDEDTEFDVKVMEAVSLAYRKNKEQMDKIPHHKRSGHFHMVVLA